MVVQSEKDGACAPRRQQAAHAAAVGRKDGGGGSSSGQDGRRQQQQQQRQQRQQRWRTASSSGSGRGGAHRTCPPPEPPRSFPALCRRHRRCEGAQVRLGKVGAAQATLRRHSPRRACTAHVPAPSCPRPSPSPPLDLHAAAAAEALAEGRGAQADVGALAGSTCTGGGSAVGEWRVELRVPPAGGPHRACNLAALLHNKQQASRRTADGLMCSLHVCPAPESWGPPSQTRRPGPPRQRRRWVRARRH